MNSKNPSQLPETFAETIAQLEQWVLRQVAQAVVRHQLYYHTEVHLRTVQRRSHQIFQTVHPSLQQQALATGTRVDFARLQWLLDFCAIAHDLVQIFEPSAQDHAPRRREPGVSENATIDQLMQAIEQFNQPLHAPSGQSASQAAAWFTESDRAIVREAVSATICHYDAVEQAIYQPLLYRTDAPPSLVTRILALADLNTLGMDGIEVYNQEGSLLFLEENPDVVPLLRDGRMQRLPTEQPALAENIRQRLLKRCRFQVNFARSRLVRLQQELQGLPEAAIAALITHTFQYLAPETVDQVERTTPTHADTPLERLLEFFAFENALNR